MVGFLPEESPLYEDTTPLSYLHFCADLYDVPREVAIERIDTSLSRLDLDHRDRCLGDMSKPMNTVVQLAIDSASPETVATTVGYGLFAIGFHAATRWLIERTDAASL